MIKEYYEIFTGLVEPFPVLRALENYTLSIPLDDDEKIILLKKQLKETQRERDFYKHKFESARFFIEKLLFQELEIK